MTCESNCCPFVYTQEMLRGKWSILIVYHIDEVEGSRFLDLKTKLSTITSTTLTKQLNLLIEHEIVEKHDNNSYPRVVTYKLTQKGVELRKIVLQFGAWGVKYQK